MRRDEESRLLDMYLAARKTSNALDLQRDVFKRSAPEIARSLKRFAARQSKSRSKARSDYQAAMSMHADDVIPG